MTVRPAGESAADSIRRANEARRQLNILSKQLPGYPVTAQDGTRYNLDHHGTFTRAVPKLKGKAAQKAARKARHDRR